MVEVSEEEDEWLRRKSGHFLGESIDFYSLFKIKPYERRPASTQSEGALGDDYIVNLQERPHAKEDRLLINCENKYALFEDAIPENIFYLYLCPSLSLFLT